ncbi:MAG: hypothetical protein GY926_10775 [bacterium]|nr:hypothetical protein [bacterium]
MIIKLAASAFAVLLLVGWAPGNAANRSDSHGADQPAVAAADELEPVIGSTAPTRRDADVAAGSEPAEDRVEWMDDLESSLAELPTFDVPDFIAEPEDPAKVRFVAEPEDPSLVCFVPVVDGYFSNCDLSTDTRTESSPGYEPAP